jgi:putative hemolysin
MPVLDILGWESLVILLLILANGVFAMSEIALVSSRKSKLQQMAEAGDAKAARALNLMAEPGRFLATVQVGITLVGTLAGAFGGVTIADRIVAEVGRVPLLAEYSRLIAIFLVVVVVTYFQVVLGELVPKALALRHAEAIARQVTGFMIGLSRAAAPVVQFLNLSTQGLLRLFGVAPATDASVTEEEIALMLAQGTREGVFHSSQREMMESVIEMGDRRITALMTARPDIEWLDADADAADLRATLASHPYSRFPVCRGGFDDLVGVVHAKDLLARFLSGQPLDLEAMAVPVPVIPDSLNVLKALEAFRVSGGTMAFVSDEYGSILGLVTLDDVLRNILGDALSLSQGAASAPAHAGDEPDAVRRADGSLLVDGTKPLVEVEELLDDQAAFSRDDEENYQTLGGYVMGRLDRIPRAGDRFDSAGWRYEVMDMDGHRVDKVLVTRVGGEELRIKNEE